MSHAAFKRPLRWCSPGGMRNVTVAGCLLALTTLATSPAAAQTYAAVISGVPALGNVVPALDEVTTFTFTPAGAVTKTGAGVRKSAGLVQGSVTLNCSGSGNLCTGAVARVRIGSTGTGLGKAGLMTNFTVGSVTGGTYTFISSTANTIDFRITQTNKSTSPTFKFGASLPISDNATGAVGGGTSPFYVWVATNPTVPSTGPSSNATVNTYRGISVASSTNLAFGTVRRANSGNTVMTVNPVGPLASYSRGVTGTGSTVSGTFSPATFTVSGEGGQMITVTVPASFSMTKTGGTTPITVNLTKSTLPTVIPTPAAALGTTAPFYVGGNFTIDSTYDAGDYSGTFDVTANYN